MKVKIQYLFLLVCALFLISCASNEARKPPIPDDAIGSFNITKKPGGKLELEIFDAKGKKVPLSHGEIPKDAKKVYEMKIELYNGSCYARVCRPFVGCETVQIDDSQCN